MCNESGSNEHKHICDELRPSRLKTDGGTKIAAVEARLAFFGKRENIFQ